MIAIITWHFKKIIEFFTIYAGFENEGTESSPDQPGMHMPQSSSINSAVPNKTSIRQFWNGIDLLIVITPGIIKMRRQHGDENNFVYF